MSGNDVAKIKELAIKFFKEGKLEVYDDIIKLLPDTNNKEQKQPNLILNFFKEISNKHDKMFKSVSTELEKINIGNYNLHIENLENKKFDENSVQALQQLSTSLICSSINCSTYYQDYYNKYYNIAMYFISIYNELMNSYAVKRLENILSGTTSQVVDNKLKEILDQDGINHIKDLITNLLDIKENDTLTVKYLYDKIIVDKNMKTNIEKIMKFFDEDFQNFEDTTKKVINETTKKSFQTFFDVIETMLNNFVKVAKSLYLCQTLSEIGQFRTFLEENLISHLISYVKIRNNELDVDADIYFNTRYYYFI